MVSEIDKPCQHELPNSSMKWKLESHQQIKEIKNYSNLTTKCLNLINHKHSIQLEESISIKIV